MNFTSGILLIFGIGVFGGIMSALVAKRLSIPQVLGYIATGIIIGETGFKLVTISDIAKLSSFNYFALGIIGFLVGSEIHFSTLKKYGRQFSAILLAEGLMSFILVGMGVTLIIYMVTHSWTIALAGGVVFGAISSATDPASTIDVLWEYRTAGILTTTLIAIVALDDALAMTLYGLGTSAAQLLAGGSVSLLHILMNISIELFGAVIVGIIVGLFLDFLIHRLYRQEQILATAISLLLLSIWLAVLLNMDIILLTMAMGITIVNKAPKRSEKLLTLVKGFSTPLYVLFFVLVGARLSLGNMPSWLWIIIVTYVVGRSLGKFSGSVIGARISNAPVVVQKYVGLGLFAQGGVAIGLSIMASQHLQSIQVADGLFLGDVIIFGVTATTFLVQLIGPPAVKVAAKLADEIGKDVTAEDVIQSWKVKDIMTKEIEPIQDKALLKQVMHSFSQTENLYHPIINSKDQVVGILTFNELRNIMLDPESWNWLVASDVASPAKEFVYENDPLEKAIKLFSQLGAEYLPVLTDSESKHFAGSADYKHIQQRINQHIVSMKSLGNE